MNNSYNLKYDNINKKEVTEQNKNHKKIAYYPGCSLNSTSIDLNISVKKLFETIGFELEEIEDWNCCGTTPAHNVSVDMPIMLSARNLLLAKKMGYDEILAPCVSCYLKLTEAAIFLNKNEDLKQNSDIKRRNELKGLLKNMGFEKELEFNFKVYSIIEFLSKNINFIRNKYIECKDKVVGIEKEILQNLNPVCYYGCVLLRTEYITKIDNAENPKIMESILEAIGIKSKKFSFKTECCGAILSLTYKNIVLKLSKQILDSAIEEGANSIVVFCPLCQQNLDLRQSQINKQYKTKYNIPVFYITQIIGLALNISYKDLMIDKLFVEPCVLLR